MAAYTRYSSQRGKLKNAVFFHVGEIQQEALKSVPYAKVGFSLYTQTGFPTRENESEKSSHQKTGAENSHMSRCGEEQHNAHKKSKDRNNAYGIDKEKFLFKISLRRNFVVGCVDKGIHLILIALRMLFGIALKILKCQAAVLLFRRAGQQLIKAVFARRQRDRAIFDADQQIIVLFFGLLSGGVFLKSNPFLAGQAHHCGRSDMIFVLRHFGFHHHNSRTRPPRCRGWNRQEFHDSNPVSPPYAAV